MFVFGMIVGAIGCIVVLILIGNFSGDLSLRKFNINNVIDVKFDDNKVDEITLSDGTTYVNNRDRYNDKWKKYNKKGFILPINDDDVNKKLGELVSHIIDNSEKFKEKESKIKTHME